VYRSHPNGDATKRVDDPNRLELTDSTPTLALRPRDAAKALGISPRLLWQFTHDGHIPCVRIGTGKRRTVLYPVADLKTWLTRQAAYGEKGQA
jgi:hypothetical protein